MTVTSTRICIFCGATPENKNLEHPLPQWLLTMTGDPNRVVLHGMNWRTDKPIRFAFDQFRFPSCTHCNSGWSDREGVMKGIVERLCRREALLPNEYVLLLDWLDKVRVGLWLGHWYHQKTPITPNFTIDTRVGTKDRMVAVYPVGNHQVGLNAIAVETPLFQHTPSVFGLRINGILLLNASWDWMCSARCGYPFPRRLELNADSRMLHVANFERRSRHVHPIRKGLMKPCVLLFQPAMRQVAVGQPWGYSLEDVQHCESTRWPQQEHVGPLFRQYLDRTEKIRPEETPIEFDSITGGECRLVRDLQLQAYSLQRQSIEHLRYVGSPDAVARLERDRKADIHYNKVWIKKVKSVTREEVDALLRREGKGNYIGLRIDRHKPSDRLERQQTKPFLTTLLKTNLIKGKTHKQALNQSRGPGTKRNKQP